MPSEISVALIWAMAEGGVIGAGDGLPWRLPVDMQWFMKTTLGKPVIMGRKTFETLPAPLPGRTNIVLTRDAAYRRPGIELVTSLAAAFDIASGIAASQPAGEIIVAGGTEIYRLALPFASRLYVTRVEAEVAGDTVFPQLDWSAWRCCWIRRYGRLPRHDHPFSTARWQRIGPATPLPTRS